MKRTNQHISLTPSEAAALRELAGATGRNNMSATVGVLVERELARLRAGGVGEKREPGAAETCGDAAARDGGDADTGRYRQGDE